MIRLEPVTPENWRTRLEVRPDQERFVAPKHASQLIVGAQDLLSV